jgi:hypothetical protein
VSAAVAAGDVVRVGTVGEVLGLGGKVVVGAVRDEGGGGRERRHLA